MMRMVKRIGDSKAMTVREREREREREKLEISRGAIEFKGGRFGCLVGKY